LVDVFVHHLRQQGEYPVRRHRNVAELHETAQVPRRRVDMADEKATTISMLLKVI
jgi:hypothetical protein